MPFRAPKKREPLTEPELMEYAVKSLATKMRSVRDLKRLMRNRAEPGPSGEEMIDRVIAKLEEMRYLSDPRFAADFTRLRQDNQKFGRRRVQQDLQNKGINKELIATTLDNAYNTINEPTLAKQYIERKRIKPPQDEKESARVLRRLVRAGFSVRTVFKVLREMKSPVEETMLDGIEDAET
ncbi:MAG: regulatory protein RecX [Acidobacteria bacterium]|nr:regulatory protein RecX [Acidobacteriota bacterium]